MKKILPLLICMPLLVMASNWESVFSYDGGTTLFVDTESIQSDGKEVSFWEKANYTKKTSDGSLSSVAFKIVNCETKAIKLIIYINYSEKDNAGTIISLNRSNSAWLHPPDRSGGFSEEINFVCLKQRR